MGADRGSAEEPVVHRRDSVLLIRLPLWFPRERSEPCIVLNQGYSAAEVGLSSAAASLPIVIGALAGGSFADRVGYRTTSVISDAASGVTVPALGLLAQFRMLPL